MKKLVFVGLLTLMLAASLGVGPASRPAAAAANGDAVPDQFIVQLAPGVDSDAAARDLAQAYGLGVLFTYRHAFNGFSAVIPAARLARLQADPRVISIVQDRYVSIDFQAGAPGPLAQSLPTGINRVDADLSPTAAIDGVDTRVDVDVAVIDTGIDLTHPDLNVAGGVNCLSRGSYADQNGHGTHVAGTIGALDNGTGVVGVAPGARVWAVRVLDRRGSGTWSQVMCGVDWVTANAAKIEVANMSLGGSGSEGTCTDGGLHQAICRSVSAGVTYAVAAGNSATDARTQVPASYDEVITVSALADFNGLPGGGAAATCRSDVDDTFADFSNYGADVDLIAPGVCINSTWLNGGYNTISGTSMASPHVAGAAALYKATHPSASPATVKSALQAAGTLDWNDADDPDPTKERLLNVGGF